MTVQFKIKVDQLPDYNADGAFPGSTNYDILVIFDFNEKTRNVSEVHLYDFAYGTPLSFKVLSASDRVALGALCRAQGEAKQLKFIEAPKVPVSTLLSDSMAIDDDPTEHKLQITFNDEMTVEKQDDV